MLTTFRLPCVVADFSGGSAPKLSVASLDQMLSLKPGDFIRKLKNILILVCCLFGLMHIAAAIAFVFDKRYQRRLLEAAQSPAFKYQVEENGAWTWLISQDRPQEMVGHLEGPLAELCKTIGTPVVRMRAAIPEELLEGDIATSLGRNIGLSADAVIASSSVLEGKLRKYNDMQGGSAYEQTVKSIQQMAVQPRGIGYGEGAAAAAAGDSKDPTRGREPRESVSRAAVGAGDVYGSVMGLTRSPSIMPSVKAVAVPTPHKPSERIRRELLGRVVLDESIAAAAQCKGVEYGSLASREKRTSSSSGDGSLRRTNAQAGTKYMASTAAVYGRSSTRGNLLTRLGEGSVFGIGRSKFQPSKIPGMAISDSPSARMGSVTLNMPTAAEGEIASFPGGGGEWEQGGFRSLVATFGRSFSPAPDQPRALSPPPSATPVSTAPAGTLSASSSQPPPAGERSESDRETVSSPRGAETKRPLSRSKSTGAQRPPPRPASVVSSGEREGSVAGARPRRVSVEGAGSCSAAPSPVGGAGEHRERRTSASSVSRAKMARPSSSSAEPLEPRVLSPPRREAIPALPPLSETSAAMSPVPASIAWGNRYEGGTRRPRRESTSVRPGGTGADASFRGRVSVAGRSADISLRSPVRPGIARILASNPDLRAVVLGSLANRALGPRVSTSLAASPAKETPPARQPRTSMVRSKSVAFTDRDYLTRDTTMSELAPVPQSPSLDPATACLTASAMMLGYLFISRSVRGTQLAELLRAGAEHFHGQTVNGYTYTDLFRRFRVLLGPGNLFTKTRWFKRCRAWRFIFLMARAPLFPNVVSRLHCAPVCLSALERSRAGPDDTFRASRLLLAPPCVSFSRTPPATGTPLRAWRLPCFRRGRCRAT